jgi:hypothetical protein
MSMTGATVQRSSGAVPELVAGLAVIVLTILGLAGVAPPFLVAIATIVFGAGLLLFGGSGVSTLSRSLADDALLGLALNGWSITFIVGLAGIVLGILALLQVVATTLVAIAVIAFGGGLLLSGRAALHVKLLAAPTDQDELHRRLMEDMAADSAGLQTMSGLAAIVLGILALSDFAPIVLLLIALLALGGFLLLSSTAFGGGLTQIFRRR